MDLDFYPGPTEVNTFGDFKHFAASIAKAYSKGFYTVSAPLAVLADEIERFRKAYAETVEPVKEEKPKLNKPIPNHGPRGKGGAFDRRGRRRW